MLKKIAVIALVAQAIAFSSHAQVRTNVSTLLATAEEQKIKDINNFQKAMSLAKQNGWLTSFTTGEGNTARLIGVDSFNAPVYFVTESNVVAAATTGASQLWNGGSSGLNLSGSSNSVKGKMALWDGAKVLGTHVELNGRVMQMDNPASFSDHSTHVAGTMIATGVSSVSKGMAYAFQELHAYDYDSHLSEMLSAAPGLLLSNHSYGTVTGWNFNSNLNRWEYYGQPGSNEDQNFGYYNIEAQIFDSIAYNAPYYLIVKSSGNNRANNGPAVGSTYYYLSGGTWTAGTRTATMSSNDGYDIISTYGTAKNILTVGAVNGIANGYSNVNDVVMSSFSSWGPTDDGRIKPDVVADGVNLQSSIAASNTSYGIFSGTSMATPNSTGSLLLLQEYYAQLHGGAFMRAATLKGIAIHCADEAGAAPGPDYKFGWGLLNVAKGANVIKSNNLQTDQIFEKTLNNGESFTMNVVASGPLTATISWTDPKGNVNSTNILNNTTRKLVNDLDIRITQGSTTYMPWILDPANPANAATTGDNVLDNVEKINISNAVPGIAYTITVTHKGTLERGQQAYSLILSGVNGQVFCASTPTSTAGARIDSVSFGSIQKLNTNACSSYSDYTSISSFVEASQVLPLTVKVNSCDATTVDKIVKAYIDFNNNGVFTDPGENVATSNVINGDGVFNASVTIAPNIVVGNPTVLRIIVQETNNPNDVNPCGSYAKGETQDYRLIFALPSNDISVDAVADPGTATCANAAQYVTVSLKNSGTAPQSGIPVTLIIKNGSTVVSTQNAVYTASIPAGETRNYTFQSPFNAAPATSYSITAIVSNTADQNRGNDTLKTTLAVSSAAAAPAGQGTICGNQAILTAINPLTPSYFWYTDPNATPIGVGISLFTSNIPANNTYYISTGARLNAGLSSKTAFPSGDYLSNTNGFMKYSSGTGLYLENARLYTKYPGKIEFIVGDITSETGTSFTYNVLSSKVIDVYATSPNVAAGTQNGYDAADTGAVFNLNLFLPAGNHAIIVKTQGNANIFRNNNVTGNPYPIGIPNLFTVTGNSAATESGTAQNFYYFLYDMKLRTSDCVSNKGTITASVSPKPVITRSGNTLSSSSTSGNQWQRNGTNISGATGQNYTVTQSGNYTVMVSDVLGCQITSDAMNVTFTAVDPVTVSGLDLVVSPNPASGMVLIRYKAERKEDMKIEVINAQGQAVQTRSYTKFIGELSERLNIQKLPAGIYVIRLQQGSRILTKKLVIE